MKKIIFFRLLVGVVLVLVMVFAGGIIFTPNDSFKESNLLETTFDTDSNSSIFLMVTRNLSDNLITGTGSSFVINARDRFIATAYHVVETSFKSTNCSIEVGVNGKFYTTSVVWRNKVADVAVVKVDNDIELTSQIKIGPSVTKGSRCFISGLQVGYLRKQPMVLSREIPVEVTVVDVSLNQIDAEIGESHQKYFENMLSLNPDFVFSDFFFTKYFVAEPIQPALDFLNGMSGCPLLNSEGEAVGVISRHNDGESIFIPTSEIPKKYWGK